LGSPKTRAAKICRIVGGGGQDTPKKMRGFVLKQLAAEDVGPPKIVYEDYVPSNINYESLASFVFLGKTKIHIFCSLHGPRNISQFIFYYYLLFIYFIIVYYYLFII
jgi:hypothetical protein